MWKKLENRYVLGDITCDLEDLMRCDFYTYDGATPDREWGEFDDEELIKIKNDLSKLLNIDVDVLNNANKITFNFATSGNWGWVNIDKRVMKDE